MSILPCMAVLLMLGCGPLSHAKAKKLEAAGAIVAIGSWLPAFAIVFLVPGAFPTIKADFFFSSRPLEVTVADLIDLYIPINPFRSPACTVLPVSAVLSIAIYSGVNLNNGTRSGLLLHDLIFL